MTKAELIQRRADKKMMSWKHAELVVEAVFASMEQSMHRGERIEIRGFGTFQVRSYKGYTGRNPSTGDRVEVAPKRLPFFKTSKNLAARIDSGGKRMGSTESVRS
jgi:integration host factor subunit beta